MDAIQYITPDFTITVTGKKVTAQLADGILPAEARLVDITNTSLGKLLLLHAAGLFGYADSGAMHDAEGKITGYKFSDGTGVDIEEPELICGQYSGGVGEKICRNPATVRRSDGFMVCPDHVEKA